MKIVILCGGLGSRLSEETKLIPKPMVKIDSLPIIRHIINYYKSFGFNEFILATGYKKNILENYFKKEKKNIKCIFTGKNTLTGGRLKRLSQYFSNDEDFMLTYGDGLSNINLKKLLKFHKKHKKIATLTSVKPPARFGEVFISGNRVSKFEEKSQLNQNWINGGFFVFKKEVFKYIKNDHTMLEREPFIKLTKKKEIIAFRHKGFWQCMDTMRDKNILKKLIKEKKAPWLNQRKK
jgi:glucose-1-phosphate cytidylyltransferase